MKTNTLTMDYSIIMADAELAAVLAGDFTWGGLFASTVAGGTGGMVGGAIAGSLAGGVGALPGAGVGFLSGAASGAVTYATYEFLMWYMS